MRSTKQEQTIYLYSGTGAFEEATGLLEKFYQNDNCQVIRVKDLSGIIPDNTHTAPGKKGEGSSYGSIKAGDLFVIGGGHAKTMINSYNHDNRVFKDDIIKLFDQGAHYLGVCAGAVLACEAVETWDEKNGSLDSSYNGIKRTELLGIAKGYTAGFFYHSKDAVTRYDEGFSRWEVQTFTSPKEKIDRHLLTVSTVGLFNSSGNKTDTRVRLSYKYNHAQVPSLGSEIPDAIISGKIKHNGELESNYYISTPHFEAAHEQDYYSFFDKEIEERKKNGLNTEYFENCLRNWKTNYNETVKWVKQTQREAGILSEQNVAIGVKK